MSLLVFAGWLTGCCCVCGRAGSSLFAFLGLAGLALVSFVLDAFADLPDDLADRVELCLSARRLDLLRRHARSR